MAGRQREDRRITRGGSALRAFITEKFRTIERFCASSRLSRVTVQRLCNGELWARVPVNLAFAVERSTGGKVKAEWFAAETAVVREPMRRTV
jgi:hypothetical protein